MNFLMDLDEGPGCAPGISQVKNAIFELYLRMEPRDAFVQDQNLVGAVPADLGALLLD